MSVSEIDVFLLEIGHNGPGVLLAATQCILGFFPWG